MKVILDTDIGSDIDDAVCLAYLLAQPECELLGITTVTGEPGERAKLASVLCKAAGKRVPIYPGADLPLLIPPRQPKCHQATALSRWEHDAAFPEGEAVEFMRHTIRAHPGEVTLLAIGPMTNLALLFAVDPQIPRLLKGLVMMIGWFWDQPTAQDNGEWNSILDPHASAMVFRAPVPLHRSVGLDVTRQVTMDADQVRQRFQRGLLRPVLDFAEVWFEGSERITFHDPLAATTLFDDQICSFQRGQVQVELDDPKIVGRTHWQPSDGPHQVATSVAPARFFEHYFSVFAR